MASWEARVSGINCTLLTDKPVHPVRAICETLSIVSDPSAYETPLDRQVLFSIAQATSNCSDSANPFTEDKDEYKVRVSQKCLTVLPR